MPLWNWVPVPIRQCPTPAARRCRRAARRCCRASARRSTRPTSPCSPTPARPPCPTHRPPPANLAAPPLRVGRHADRPLAEGGGGQVARQAPQGRQRVGGCRRRQPRCVPSSGGLASVKALARRHLKPVHRLKHAASTPAARTSSTTVPVLQVQRRGLLHPPDDGQVAMIGREHHIGCMLTHLKARMTAREANASAAVVQESGILRRRRPRLRRRPRRAPRRR